MAVLEWEELLVSLTHALPQPVEEETALDGSTVLVGGDPGEVVVRVTASSVTVFEFAVRWEGPRSPVTRPIAFGRIRWRRFDSVRALQVLTALILEARESRRAKYVACLSCERLTAPEQMYDGDLCQACARRV
jgi:hypothetical protein